MESKNMRILVLDTETTGLNLNTSKICQIAGRIEEIDANGKFSKKGEFAIHCCPSDMTEAAWEAAKKSFEINHLSRELLTGKPDEIAVLNELANIIATYKVDYLVGQNIMEYDLPLMINRLGETSTFSQRLLNIPCLDTKLISYAINPSEKNHSLKNLAERYSIKQKNAHDAMDDVNVTLAVFKKFFKSSGKIGIKKFGLKLSQTPRYNFEDYRRNDGFYHIPVCIKKKYVFNSIDIIEKTDAWFYEKNILSEMKKVFVLQ